MILSSFIQCPELTTGSHNHLQPTTAVKACQYAFHDDGVAGQVFKSLVEQMGERQDGIKQHSLHVQGPAKADLEEVEL